VRDVVFFFQAEDGIRDFHVTGVQTCALPIFGTHALLGSSIKFANLGLLIIDEEQHFGVKHKERLKELKSDVHVLTLSATPIPRRSEERRVGKERASRRAPKHCKTRTRGDACK